MADEHEKIEPMLVVEEGEIPPVDTPYFRAPVLRRAAKTTEPEGEKKDENETP